MRDSLPMCRIVMSADDVTKPAGWVVEVSAGTLRPEDVEAWFWHLAEAATSARLLSEPSEVFSAEVLKTAATLEGRRP